MGLTFQFFAQNAHFAVNLLAALVMLMIAWLYFDSWQVKKDAIGLWRWVAFTLLAISFAIHGTSVEESFLVKSVFGQSVDYFAAIFKLLGYGLAIFSQVIDPLQEIPQTEGLSMETSQSAKGAVVGVGGGVFLGLKVLTPLAAAGLAGLYWRRATTGLERHLKPVAIGFLLLALADLLGLSSLGQDSQSVFIYNATRNFGALWLAEHLLVVAGVALLGKWVWQYLVRRLQSQLFMIFSATVTLIFLVVTTTFTFLLMRNVVDESLSNLSVATRVLNYALESRQAETLAHAEALSQNPLVVDAIKQGNHDGLASATSEFLAKKKQSSLIITNADGQVIFRAEDPDRYGDSLSEDTLVRRSLVGIEDSTVLTREGTAAPLVNIRSTVPVREGSLVVGTVSVGLVVGDDFVDGVKRATGLDSTVYAGNVRSATTFVEADGKSRQIGIKEEAPAINSRVLKQGKEFRGTISLLNRPFLAVFAPLKDADNTTIGMLFAGKQQVSVLQAAGRSIELSFIMAVILLLLSVFPSYFISRYITRQLE